MKIWRDGRLINWSEATIHVLNHVVHYGSSIFEGIRCYETPNGGAIFRLQDHLRRLFDSAKIYRMPMKHSLDEMTQACIEAVAGNDLKECYLRPLVIRTGERMGIFPDADGRGPDRAEPGVGRPTSMSTARPHGTGNCRAHQR